MKIVFDRGQQNERSLLFDRINERPGDMVLSGSYDRTVDSPEDFQDISGFVENKEFDTIHVLTDQNTEIPICDGYNYISDLMATYYEKNKSYSLSITVVKQSENPDLI